MKVILSQDVENLGRTGDTVKVADGYGRNFLLPRKMAVQADSGSAKQIQHERRVIQMREEKRRAELTGVAKKLENVSIEFKVRAGAEDKLFGSITVQQIAERLVELGFAIDRKMVLLDEPIKSLGIFTVAVRLAHGIEPNVKIWVNSIEEAPAEAVAASSGAETV